MCLESWGGHERVCARLLLQKQQRKHLYRNPKIPLKMPDAAQVALLSITGTALLFACFFAGIMTGRRLLRPTPPPPPTAANDAERGLAKKIRPVAQPRPKRPKSPVCSEDDSEEAVAALFSSLHARRPHAKPAMQSSVPGNAAGRYAFAGTTDHDLLALLARNPGVVLATGPKRPGKASAKSTLDEQLAAEFWAQTASATSSETHQHQ